MGETMVLSRKTKVELILRGCSADLTKLSLANGGKTMKDKLVLSCNME